MRIEACATDQQSINLFKCQIVSRTTSRHATAIQHGDIFGCLLAIQMFNLATDCFNSSCHIRWQSVIARTNCPDRLVGNDNLLKLVTGDIGKSADQLVMQDIVRFTVGALSCRLANTKNWANVVAD
ncbi:hypothetical protein D3C72_1762790 [compost metagenome]